MITFLSLNVTIFKDPLKQPIIRYDQVENYINKNALIVDMFLKKEMCIIKMFELCGNIMLNTGVECNALPRIIRR